MWALERRYKRKKIAKYLSNHQFFFFITIMRFKFYCFRDKNHSQHLKYNSNFTSVTIILTVFI